MFQKNSGEIDNEPGFWEAGPVPTPPPGSDGNLCGG